MLPTRSSLRILCKCSIDFYLRKSSKFCLLLPFLLFPFPSLPVPCVRPASRCPSSCQFCISGSRGLTPPVTEFLGIGAMDIFTPVSLGWQLRRGIDEEGVSETEQGVVSDLFDLTEGQVHHCVSKSQPCFGCTSESRVLLAEAGTFPGFISLGI